VISVVLACGASKRDHPAPAWDLYTGPYFRAGLAWAQSVTDLDHIWILSAKYGLVPSRTQLEPYERRLKRGALGDTMLRQQARTLGLGGRTLFVCGGIDYADALTAVGLIVSRPFAHPRFGQGKQIGLMRSCLGRFPEAADYERYAA
jgi:hypothetical protein